MRIATTLLVPVLLIACSPEEETDTMAMSPCEQEERDIDLQAGSQIEKSDLTLSFASLEPEVPFVDDNVWILEFLDTSSESVSDCALDATTFMPDHDHGGAVPTFSETDGSYTMNVDFMMGGYWEIDLTAECDATSERYLIKVCVES